MAAREGGVSERRAGYEARAVLDAATREADFQRGVVAFARLNGWRCHWTYDSRRSPEGWPDLVACRGGRLVIAELKSERGRLSADQSDWLCLLRQVPGVEVFLWRPSDWNEIERTFGRTSVAKDTGAASGGAPAREATG
jgi:hypothetical protein